MTFQTTPSRFKLDYYKESNQVYISVSPGTERKKRKYVYEGRLLLQDCWIHLSTVRHSRMEFLPTLFFFTSVQKFCEHTDRRKSSPALLFDVQQRSENIPIRRTINKVTGIVFTLSVTPADSIFSLALLYCSSGVPLRTVIRQFKL